MRSVLTTIAVGTFTAGLLAAPLPGWSQSSVAAGSTTSSAGLPSSVVQGLSRSGELNLFQRGLMSPAPSIARADLAACNQLSTARPLEGADLSSGDLARQFEGTWVRELTWNGVLVDTESVLYFSFENRNFDDPAYSSNFTGLMYDQSNTGKRGPWNQRAQDIRSNVRELTRTTTLTFVDCVHNIVDKYYKVSNESVVRGLDDFVDANLDVMRSGVARDRTGEPGSGLGQLWDQLTRSRLFEPSHIQGIQRSLGFDPQRLPLQRGGTLTEVTTPSVGGALFKGSVRNAALTGYEGISQGATMEMRGDYRGAHVGAAGEGQRVQFEGKEAAQFMREGNSLVATQRPLGADGILNGEIAQGWVTDCASFFGLNDAVIWQRVVLAKGVQ